MSIKRISRKRVVAPLAQHVEEEPLGTQASRRTVTDQKHGADNCQIVKSSPDTARTTVPNDKASVPTNKSTVPANRFSV